MPARLEALAAEIAALSDRLADSGLFVRDAAAFGRVSADLEARHAELAAAEERWLELESLREELER